MEVIIVNDWNFDEEVLKSKWVVLVDFWAEWCGPCQMMLPILKEFAAEMWDKMKVAKLNVDEAPTTAQSFRVMSIPTLLVFKDGKPVEQMVWVKQLDELKEVCEKHID